VPGALTVATPESGWDGVSVRGQEGVIVEIDPCERDPVATEEVAQVLHVRRVPPTDERDVTLAVGGQLDHARLQWLVG
jgi:hypothetical protein